MFALRLCYAWTIWKAQGQTLIGKVVVSLGNREREHGLTYTAFSRVQRLCNLGVIDGFPFDRISKAVKQQPKMAGRIKAERRLRRLVKSTIAFLTNLE